MKHKLSITVMMALTICLSFALASGAVAQTYNIYFGDLHTHTGYSDGSGTPAQAFQQAKSSGQADFMAITDHAWMSRQAWADTVAQADNFTDSTFVAIAAFEYCKPWGHMCTFDDLQILLRKGDQSTQQVCMDGSRLDNEVGQASAITPSEGRKVLRNLSCITVTTVMQENLLYGCQALR